MSPRRALLICPGRGSYDRHQLGSLKNRGPQAERIIQACDAWRQREGRPSVSEMDAAERYQSRLHVAGQNSSLLTFACSLADWAELSRQHFQVVGVTGNSMGWYTALVASGALSLEDGIRLVDTMGVYQEGNVLGGQILYPVTGSDWLPDQEKRNAVESALATTRAEGHFAAWSILLGGYAVLGADAEGLRSLLNALPTVKLGSREFPVQLPLHSAFHTSLMQETARRAQKELQGLDFCAPHVPLIDGRGFVFRPSWASPKDIRDYTLGHQVTEPYDYSTAVRSALRHTGAEVALLLGPGNSLGAATAQILVQEGWRGSREKAQFQKLQNEKPLLLSFGVTEQRQILSGKSSS